MASRSPTLRASAEPYSTDVEKDARPLDSARYEDSQRPYMSGDGEKRRRSSLGSAFRGQSVDMESDPFGDEDDGDGVKYRTLKWW